jgi:hypothetical protein
VTIFPPRSAASRVPLRERPFRSSGGEAQPPETGGDQMTRPGIQLHAD